MGYDAYKKTQNVSTTSPRDLEYRLLGSVTAALLDAETDPDQVAKRAEAVCWNREVWAAFRGDLLHQGNQLPQHIKDDLVDLSRWVDRETARVLTGATDKLDGLIEVNKNIMNGLAPPSSPAGS